MQQTEPILNPVEKMNRVLIHVSRKQETLEQYVQIFFEKEHEEVFAASAEEIIYVLQLLNERGFLEMRSPLSMGRSNAFYRLTPEGWEAASNLHRGNPSSDQAFVAMWFIEDLQDAYENGIKPALEATLYVPVRVDRIQHNEKIDDIIVSEIRRSGLVVADFTGNRQGVYFEAGFAMGLGIPVIWTCRDTDIDDVHFDTRQYNHVLWSTPDQLTERLQNRITATIPGRSIRDSV